ncbi:hypothetical protein [Hyphomicrobium sp.]|uniref:hypothetical protein n=1 Tax=Hyphomicrobium sp. TaxID=82 RepID=UPI003F6FE69E
MPNARLVSALALMVAWSVFSTSYYLLVYLPSARGILIGLAAVATLAVSIICLLPKRKLTLVYVAALMIPTYLSSLQFSFDQRPFTPEFVYFFSVHFIILGCAIFAGESLSTSRVVLRENHKRLVVPLALYALIGIACYVTYSKGMRATDFAEGVKVSGDAYKIGGLSGIQGVLTIFVFCCFSLLGRVHKVVFVIVTLALSIIDVKRGDAMRMIIFLVMLVIATAGESRISRKVVVSGTLLVISSVVVLVVAGEIRQDLYSPGSSISEMLQSRVNSTALSWLYGYIGINASVLMETFEAPFDPPGYFSTLVALLLTSQDVDLGVVPSINGFNAGTVFATFAGNERILPSYDFIGFCIVLGAMVAAAGAAIPSLQAFLMLQIFGFSFGNQLILPYYLVGFALSVAYVRLFNGRRLYPLSATPPVRVPRIA